MKDFYLARIQCTLNPGEESQARMNSVMKKIANRNKPKKYSPGSGNVLIEHLAEYEKQCALIEKYYSVRADTLTLYQFISRLNSIKEEIKLQSKAGGLQMEQKA